MSAASEGSSRSKRRVALATRRKLKTLFGGASGGDARGAAQGAKPHNRPLLAARRAGVPNFAGGRNSVPEGQKNQTNIPARTGETARPQGGMNQMISSGFIGPTGAGQVKLRLPTPHTPPMP